MVCASKVRETTPNGGARSQTRLVRNARMRNESGVTHLGGELVRLVAQHGARQLAGGAQSERGVPLARHGVRLQRQRPRRNALVNAHVRSVEQA